MYIYRKVHIYLMPITILPSFQLIAQKPSEDLIIEFFRCDGQSDNRTGIIKILTKDTIYISNFERLYQQTRVATPWQFYVNLYLYENQIN